MLKGDKIILRPLKITDLDKTIQWRNDIELLKLTQGIRFPKTHEMEKAWFDNVLNDTSNKNIYFGIDEISTNNFIGIIQLNNIDYISRNCEFGIVIPDSKNQGKGYAKNAMQLLFDYATNVLNLKKIYLKVIDINEKAKKLYINFGFKDEGLLKEHVYYDKRFYDLYIMSLFIN
jgi:RimJ/RimL family protein N-acetyltransferase